MRWMVEYRTVFHGVCRDCFNPGDIKTYASKPIDHERKVEGPSPDDWLTDLRSQQEAMVANPREALGAVAPYTDAGAEEVLEIYAIHPLDDEARMDKRNWRLVFELMGGSPELKPAH